MNPWKSLLSCLVFSALGTASMAFAGNDHSAVKPVPRDANWTSRHDKFVEIAKRGGVDVLFLGDSITDAWGGEGHGQNSPGSKLFTEKFVPLKAANFGIGGDRTQHILWRLQNGELQGINPKVVMLMIGTNNSNGKDNTASEISEGVKAIVGEIQKQSPSTKVLLLAIFPRATGKDLDNQKVQTAKINQVNESIAKLNDGKKVKFLDINKNFFAADGSIPTDLMPDQLHLSPKGYSLWATAVESEIKTLIQDQPAAVTLVRKKIDPPAAVARVKEKAETIVNRAKEKVDAPAAGARVKEKVETIVNRAKEKVDAPAAGARVKEKVETIMDRAKEKTDPIVGRAKEKTEGLLSRVKEKVGTAMAPEGRKKIFENGRLRGRLSILKD